MNECGITVQPPLDPKLVGLISVHVNLKVRSFQQQKLLVVTGWCFRPSYLTFFPLDHFSKFRGKNNSNSFFSKFSPSYDKIHP